MWTIKPDDIEQAYYDETTPGSLTPVRLQEMFGITNEEIFPILQTLVKRGDLVERKGQRWSVEGRKRSTYWSDHLKHRDKPEIW